MATFNRKDLTIRCILQLQKMRNINTEIQIVVCDDRSSDGTFETIQSRFPDVHVIQSGGEEFWAKTMHLADIEAQKYEYDYLVWLNDDTDVYVSAFESILADYLLLDGEPAILVGALADPITKARTYSGCFFTEIENKIELEFISPFGLPVKIGMFSGNFVCVPRVVRDAIGPISHNFSHGWADMEYGFRARKFNYSSYLMSVFVGESPLNPLYSFHRNSRISLLSRMKHIYGRKAYHPKDYLRFCLLAFGAKGIPIYFVNMIRVGKETLNAGPDLAGTK